MVTSFSINKLIFDHFSSSFHLLSGLRSIIIDVVFRMHPDLLNIMWDIFVRVFMCHYHVLFYFYYNFFASLECFFSAKFLYQTLVRRGAATINTGNRSTGTECVALCEGNREWHIPVPMCAHILILQHYTSLIRIKTAWILFYSKKTGCSSSTTVFVVVLSEHTSSWKAKWNIGKNALWRMIFLYSWLRFK